MSNLTPTPVTDKNGKQTTVHKRSGDTPKASERVRSVAPAKATDAEWVEPLPAADFNGAGWELTHAEDERTFKMRTAALEAYRAGESHLYENHYDAMWADRAINILGEKDGRSEVYVRRNFDAVTALRKQVEAGEVTASELIPTHEGGTQEEALQWCDTVLKALEEAIETEGRSLALNAKHAFWRYRDFEGGGNFR